MSKIVVAFVGGVAVGGLAFSLLSGEREQIGRSEPTMVESILPARTIVERSLPELRSDGRDVDMMEESTGPATSMEADVKPGAESAAAAVPLLPLWLPAEFQWFSSNPGFLALQRENVDPFWSTQTETQIGRYFTERSELTAKYGVPVVQCRTSGCQVLVTAFGRTGSSLREEFRQSVSEYSEQPWAAQFGIGLVSTNSANGVETLVWTLKRKEDN